MLSNKTSKKLLIKAITLFSFLVIGNNEVVAETLNIHADTGHGDKHGGGAAHSHEAMEIPPGQPIPSVNLVVHKDAMQGYNLEVQVTNFKFALEQVNNAAKLGEGHAHIYVNGQKVARLYSSWYHLENLQPGNNKITVVLNANNHQALAHNGRQIEDTKVIEVPAGTNQR